MWLDILLPACVVKWFCDLSKNIRIVKLELQMRPIRGKMVKLFGVITFRCQQHHLITGCDDVECGQRKLNSKHFNHFNLFINSCYKSHLKYYSFTIIIC